MNLEPLNTESEIRNHSGTARVLASLVIIVMAVLTILVVADVIPRSAYSEMAGKVGLIAGVCGLSVLAIGLLARR
jgi:hypothetical protein